MNNKLEIIRKIHKDLLKHLLIYLNENYESKGYFSNYTDSALIEVATDILAASMSKYSEEDKALIYEQIRYKTDIMKQMLNKDK